MKRLFDARPSLGMHTQPPAAAPACQNPGARLIERSFHFFLQHAPNPRSAVCSPRAGDIVLPAYMAAWLPLMMHSVQDSAISVSRRPAYNNSIIDLESTIMYMYIHTEYRWAMFPSLYALEGHSTRGSLRNEHSTARPSVPTSVQKSLMRRSSSMVLEASLF